ncbi:hypothetical protein GX865_03315 [Candidatus Saccharibacteria bacterium]|jgi:hypothetical protein|nr:hypothetical protein [Candidatus Saccharibacteria bacterium]
MSFAFITLTIAFFALTILFVWAKSHPAFWLAGVTMTISMAAGLMGWLTWKTIGVFVSVIAVTLLLALIVRTPKVFAVPVVASLTILSIGAFMATNGVAQAESISLTSNGVVDSGSVQSHVSGNDITSNPASEVAEIRYFAYEAEAGTNNFGPAFHFDSAQDALGRVELKLRQDPLYAAAIYKAVTHGKDLSEEDVYRGAEAMVADRQLQQNTANTFMDNIQEAWLADFGESEYYSLGMIPGENPNEMPKLTKMTRLPHLGQALVVKMNNGRSVVLRAACDLQPSFRTDMPNVQAPETPEKAPTAPIRTYAPPTGGAQPPAPRTTEPSSPRTTGTTTPSTTQPSSTQPTQPTTSTTTPTTATTTPTTSTTTPTTTTTEPTTPTTPSEGKDPSAGPQPPEGHTPAPAPSGEPEPTPPVEPIPADPSIPADDPAPGVPAPGASDVPSEPRPTEDLPAPIEPAPDPSDPGTSIPDPDGPAAVQEPSSPIQQEVPVDQGGLNQAPEPISPAEQEAPIQEAPVDQGIGEAGDSEVGNDEVMVEMTGYSKSAVNLTLIMSVVALALMLAGGFVRPKDH